MQGSLGHVDHIGYTVSDLEASVAFWSDLLGIEPKATKSWAVPYLGRIQGYEDVRVTASFFDLPGGLTLELVAYENPSHGLVDMETYNVGNAHMAFVTEDLAGVFERMRGRAEFRSANPVRIEWGPYEGGYAGRLRDPDGITVELVQLPDGGVQL
jgi:catechol 2,3-dioxygenase-like lactoylglutathione lyase family enzyme